MNFYNRKVNALFYHKIGLSLKINFFKLKKIAFHPLDRIQESYVVHTRVGLDRTLINHFYSFWFRGPEI